MNFSKFMDSVKFYLKYLFHLQALKKENEKLRKILSEIEEEVNVDQDYFLNEDPVDIVFIC